jgi:hypothetical protein
VSRYWTATLRNSVINANAYLTNSSMSVSSSSATGHRVADAKHKKEIPMTPTPSCLIGSCCSSWRRRRRYVPRRLLAPLAASSASCEGKNAEEMKEKKKTNKNRTTPADKVPPPEQREEVAEERQRLAALVAQFRCVYLSFPNYSLFTLLKR